jgi:hypothetical protein
MSCPRPAADPCAAEPTIPEGWLPLLDALLETWREMLAVRVELFTRELRDTGVAIAAMIGMAVAAACLAACGWLVQLGLGLELAVKSGLSWEAAGMLVFVLNALAFARLVVAVRQTAAGILANTIASLQSSSRDQGHEPLA